MKESQCTRCYYAEVHVERAVRPIFAQSWRVMPYQELHIWCRKKFFNVRFPYKKCPDRLERQKLSIDKYGEAEKDE